MNVYLGMCVNAFRNNDLLKASEEVKYCMLTTDDSDELRAKRESSCYSILHSDLKPMDLSDTLVNCPFPEPCAVLARLLTL